MKAHSLLVVISLAAVVAACGNNDQSAPESPVGASTQAPPQPSGPYAAGEVLPESEFVADASEVPPGGGGCSVDAINGTAGELTPVSEEAVLEGWAVTSEVAATGDAMLALSNASNRYTAGLERVLERSDVAAALQREDALMSGFKQRVDLAAVAPGEYAVHVRVGGIQCDTGRRLVVGS